MDLFPRQVDFESIWAKLRSATSAFILGQGQLSKALWKERFSDVYSVCIAVPKPLGERLYRELKAFFEQHVSDIYDQVRKSGEENLLTEYYRHWQTYSAGVAYLNQLYAYVNTYVVKKHKYCQVNIDYSLYGIDYDDHMLEIAELAMNTWEQLMVHSQKEQLVTCLLREIAKDRSGVIANHNALHGVIMSFVDMSRFRSRSQLRLYEDLFEIPFFKASSDFVKHESQRLRDTCNCSTFMTKVAQLMSDEAVRSRRFLHESSHERILVDCQMALLCDENVEFMNSQCRVFVQREQWSDLATMYQLLNPLENKLGTLLSEVEQHLFDVGLAAIQSLPSTGNVAKTFVEVLLNFHSKYKEHVEHTFKSNLLFMNALDKACTAAVNHKKDPKSLCRSAELLSKYCDELLHKGIKGQSEMEIDDCLNHAAALFTYIEDKDIFERFYARNLARRLIFGQSLSMDLEESMINRLKQICGYEYTNKLRRMFTDMTISTDLVAKFNEYLQAKSIKHHTFSIAVLQAGAWPIYHNNLTSFDLPLELVKSVQLFEEFYKSQYSGRKLTWLHNLSVVELRLNYCKRPYILTTDIFPVAVLLAFNEVEHLSCDELKESTQLSIDDVVRLVRLLVDAKILTSSGPVNEQGTFELNKQYNNKRTKFRITSGSPAEVNQEAVQMRQAADADRRMCLQAALVRIMKARKELRHNILIEEVIVQSKSRFTPDITMIKKCIDILIEKEYIQRSENCPDNYIYIA